jgi:ribosomal-protein-alanine N-acetyltransferase
MKPFPELKTERLLLNQLKAKDIPLIVRYASNPKISEYTLNIPHPYHEEDAIYWLNMAHSGFKSGEHYTFAIRLHTDPAFIGGIGLVVNRRYNRAEIGYWMAEPFWNRGYVTEASKAVIQFGFEQLGLHKINCRHFASNAGSKKVILKSGFQQEGLLRDEVFKHGLHHDILVYSILRSEYSNGKNMIV